MANDREIELLIRAQNQTTAAFEAARKGIAGVRVEADAAKAAGLGFSSAWSSATKVLGTLGIGIGVGAIASFAKGVFDAASEIKDLSGAMGLSIGATQRFKFAAEQGGATINDVGRAVSYMNRVLAEGDKATITSLKAAGLSFDAIRAMKPEDAFLAIADAVKNIPDPMLQTEVAMRLFGRGAVELLPQIKDGFREAADAATVMSDETVNRLEAAQQTWENFWHRVTVISGEALGKIGQIVDRASDRDVKASKVVAFAQREKIAVAEAWRVVMAKTAGEQEQFFRTGSFEAKKASDVNLGLAGAYKGVSESLVEKQRREDAAAKAAEAHLKTIRAQRDELSGAKLQGQVRDLAQAVSMLTAQQLQQEPVMHRIGAAAKRLFDEGAVLTPQLFRLYVETQRLIPVASGLGKEIEGLGKSFAMAYDSSVPFMGMLDGLKDLPGLELPKPEAPTATPTFLRGIFGSSQQFGQVLSQTILDAIKGGGNAVAAAGSMIGSQLLGGWAKHLTTATASGTATLSGWLGGIANAVLPMVGSLLGPLASKIGSFFSGLFDRNKGRDLVKDFAEGFGGFDALREKLLVLGDAGERLWIRLTQGVGRNSPDQAKAAIEAINAALGDQESTSARLQAAIEKYGISWEELGPKARGAKLNELAQALVEDFNLLADAEIDVGIISERMAATVNDFLHRAMKTGQEIPAAMRPMLERMIEFGQITDENGNKLESLEGITFAETLSQGVDRIVAKMDELIDRVGNRLGGAISGVFRGIPERVDVEIHGRRTGEWPDDSREPGFAVGTPGLDFVDFRRASRVVLHGEEAVVPRSRVGDLAGQVAAALMPALASAITPHETSTGGNTNVSVSIGGQEIKDFIVRTVREGVAQGLVPISTSALVRQSSYA